MRAYSLTHLSDAALLHGLAALIAQDRATNADLLAHVAEVDARRLYVPAGYASMHAYCVDALRLSEDAAYKRIQVARAGRRFPALLDALAGGRLHLTGACRLAPHLTPENVVELLAAATHRRVSEIDEMLARRFPVMEATLCARGPWALRPPTEPQLVSKPVATGGPDPVALEAASGPLPSPERFALTIGRVTHDKLRYAQALLTHARPSPEVSQVLDRALDALIERLERRKFGAKSRSDRQEPKLGQRPERGSEPGPGPGSESGPESKPGPSPRPKRRHIPAWIRRAVWERDAGRCTFVGEGGHRCGELRLVEFDHVDPVARGGRTIVERLRLRCRAHNQFEAERAFGTAFMESKRGAVRADSSARSTPPGRLDDADDANDADVVLGLRTLGLRAAEARRAVAASATTSAASIEERLRAALRVSGALVGRRVTSTPAPGPISAPVPGHG